METARTANACRAAGDEDVWRNPERAYAHLLLSQLGCRPATIMGLGDPPALGWRRSGLMALTGAPDGQPLMAPAALGSAADGALMALKALAPHAHFPAQGAMLLGERARMLGLSRQGRVSANGSCHLFDAADGRLALNLARPDDMLLVSILAGCDAGDLTSVANAIRLMRVDSVMAQAIEIGLPIARDRPAPSGTALFAPVGPAMRTGGRPLVVDFSALWAGPLAASLLHMAGAEVIKVESRTRLDGARAGSPGFYNLLNAGKRSVVIDFADDNALRALHRLVARADIVIEASRPRALRRLGIDRDAAVARGTVWVGITAYADEDRIGFGDDAAVEAGLVSAMEACCGEAVFVGDAIADPLTGIHAALAAWAGWLSGKGALLPLSLAGTASHAMQAGIADRAVYADWQRQAEADTAPLYPLRADRGVARQAGADTREVLDRC